MFVSGRPEQEEQSDTMLEHMFFRLNGSLWGTGSTDNFGLRKFSNAFHS